MAVKLIAMFRPVVTAVWSPALLLSTPWCHVLQQALRFGSFVYVLHMQFSTSKLCNNYDETHIYELFLLHLTSHSKISANIRLGKS